MERFEMKKETNQDVFSNFVTKAKDTFAELSENIKENIKKYETNIEDTEKEISDTRASREKCEHEISKMESKIDSIKEAIENVESTYKKIVDAYSSTSKGDTKDIYSDIIDGAKSNCEKDVEKNRTEIARLNSDIEAIKNNIAEFDRVIEELSKNLDGYKVELSKYKKANDYFEKTNDKVIEDLGEIEENKYARPKVSPRKIQKENKEDEVEKPIVQEEIKPFENKKASEIIEEVPVTEAPKAETKEEIKNELNDIDDSLQRIYDLTGYKPVNKEEKHVEENVTPISEPVYSGNLENLFANNTEDLKVQNEAVDNNSYSDNDMSEWEKILNGGEDDFNLNSIMGEETQKNANVVETSVKTSILENVEDTVNQLLMPYGTSFNRLKSLTSGKITHKDGTIIPFELTYDDVTRAINSVDGNDLKTMKIVGPEITLLRKVKAMKEGK